MKVYTIHLRPGSLSPDRDAVAVKEGFCWPAFFLGPLWALWHRMWRAAVFIVLALSAVGAAVALIEPDPATDFAISLAVSVLIGYCANDWRRASLARAGWRFEALSAAADRDAAMRRFFDLHPEAAGAAPGAAV
jgi:hypothetical protein